MAQSAKLLTPLRVSNLTGGIGLRLIFWEMKKGRKDDSRAESGTGRYAELLPIRTCTFSPVLKFIHCQINSNCTIGKPETFSLIANLLKLCCQAKWKTPLCNLNLSSFAKPPYPALHFLSHLSSFLLSTTAGNPSGSPHAIITPRLVLSDKSLPLTTFRGVACNPMAVSRSANAF